MIYYIMLMFNLVYLVMLGVTIYLIAKSFEDNLLNLRLEKLLDLQATLVFVLIFFPVLINLCGIHVIITLLKAGIITL